MKYCGKCGTQLGDNAVVYSKCGQPCNNTSNATINSSTMYVNNYRTDKPVYKKWWFWLIVGAFVLFVIIAVFGEDSDKKETTSNPENSSSSYTSETNSEDIVYNHYDVVTLFDELDDNALKAEQAHNDEYIEIEGYISNIDSDGKYISVGSDPDDYDHLFDRIMCYIKNKEQKNTVINAHKDDKVIIRGKIKSIGEVLGYSLNISEIEIVE